MIDGLGAFSGSNGRRRWTRVEYGHMGDMGLFDGVRVELLNGDVWNVPPQTPPHYTAVRLASVLLKAALGGSHTVRPQGPIVLSDDSEPEPDVVVVPGTARDYADHHPTPGEVRLLVEVSDATLAMDRGSKRGAYAREGIAEYWIINLVDRQLEVHRDPASLPTDPGYKTRQVLVEGDTVTPLFASGSAIAVADLLPPIAPP